MLPGGYVLWHDCSVYLMLNFQTCSLVDLECYLLLDDPLIHALIWGIYLFLHHVGLKKKWNIAKKKWKYYGRLKVNKSLKQFKLSSILPKANKNSLSWASFFFRKYSEQCFFVRFWGELRTPFSDLYQHCFPKLRRITTLHIFNFFHRTQMAQSRQHFS